MSQSSSVVARPLLSATASKTQSSGHVRKNETSPSASQRKRKSTARQKLRHVFREQKRFARAHNLRAVAITLPYADNAKWEPGHISALLDKVRSFMKQAGHPLPYIWTLESAGRLHYHLLLWLPRGVKLDPVHLEKWWPWGNTWTKSCRNPSAWHGYITKFNSLTKLPKGVHSYGKGGLDDAGKKAVLLASLPRWLVRILPAGHLARRAPGGGWVDLETGEIYLSPHFWTPWGFKHVSTLATRHEESSPRVNPPSHDKRPSSLLAL